MLLSHKIHISKITLPHVRLMDRVTNADVCDFHKMRSFKFI